MPLPRVSAKLANIAKSTRPSSSTSFYEVSGLGIDLKDIKEEPSKKRSSSRVKEETTEKEITKTETKPMAKKRVKKEEKDEKKNAAQSPSSALKEHIADLESQTEDNFQPLAPATNQVAATARHWVVKSEPDVYGIDHIMAEREGVWDGVHNYQARNFMKLFKRDDLLYFYHSNCTVPGIYGLMKVTDEHSPDPTALDPKNRNFDKRIKKPELNPWVKVGTRFVRKYEHPLSLTSLKEIKELQTNILVKRGNRLSVMPLSVDQHEAIWDALEKINPNNEV